MRCHSHGRVFRDQVLAVASPVPEGSKQNRGFQLRGSVSALTRMTVPYPAAIAAGIPVYLIDGEQAKPRRVRVGDEAS
jgi:hypothetical protein